jgi:hemolysin activation/secretion protein
LEAQGQWASDILPVSERFGLGNASIGRGFAPGNTSGDEGFGVRFEVRKSIQGNWFSTGQSAVQLYGFGDYGEAYDKSSARDGQRREKLASVGVGARLDVSPDASLVFEIARQLEGVANDTRSQTHETRVFLSVVKRF